MLHPDPLAVARFTHPALSSTHSLPGNPNSPHIHLYLVFSRSLLLPRAARSLDVAAALSNSRCNIQRLLAVVCGGGSAIATKKRAPRGRSLRPSNWRRCPSTVARAIASLSLFSHPSCCRPPFLSSSPSSCSHPRSRHFSCSLFFAFLSLSIPRVFIVSFSFATSSLSFALHRRPLDIEALMQPSSRRWWFMPESRV